MTQSVTESNATSLGRRIALARKEAGYTVRQLADVLGVDPRTVARWQSNEAAPSLERLGEIAHALDKSPSYFLEAPA